MPRNPFRAWSPNSNPDGIDALFSPLFAEQRAAAPASWRPINYAPAVGSTKALIEARFESGMSSALKALVPHGPAMARWQASTDVNHPLYWARESCFFKNPASQVASTAFRPVRCLDQVTTSEQILMRFEWVEGTPGSEWRVSDYEQAAYALGTWQRTIKCLPNAPWVCPDWLGGYLALREGALASLSEPALWSRHNTFSVQEQELVSQCLERLRGLREQLHACQKLPAHNDFWPPNLFMSQEQLVAIDWAFVGPAAMGSDIVTLLFDAIYDGFLRPSDSNTLLTQIKRAYAEGAEIADDSSLEFALHAGLVVKYLWFFAHVLSSDEEIRRFQLEALQLVLSSARTLNQINKL
ncbi:MAG: phosphotransferase [Gammaproteobacteria bacterium]|nr:phosphotransferase [Gammaproteobacteria bacterium]